MALHSQGKQKKAIFEDMIIKKKPSPSLSAAPQKKEAQESDAFQKKGHSLFLERSNAASHIQGVIPSAHQKKQRKRRWYGARPLLILYGVLAFTLFVVLVDAFSGVYIRVTPHQEFFKIDTLLQLSAEAGEGARIETVHFEERMEASRATSGQKKVEEKARGTVTIYNEFSSAPQVLLRRTRLEAPNGKIYRLAEQVTVPGAKIVDGTIHPSSIDSMVYADEPGEEYNSGPADFIIPGFKGSPRYEKFYARSSGAITGGFTGISKVVTEDDIRELNASLDSQLREKLARRSREELPNTIMIPEGASRIITIEKHLSNEAGKPADSVSLELVLRFDGFAFAFDALERELIGKYVDKGVNDTAFEIVNIRNLGYRIEKINFDQEEATLRIQGLGHVVWKVDSASLAAHLAAAGYRQQINVFSQYPQIEEAIISFSPSWWRVFPNNPKKITIERKLFESP